MVRNRFADSSPTSCKAAPRHQNVTGRGSTQAAGPDHVRSLPTLIACGPGDRRPASAVTDVAFWWLPGRSRAFALVFLEWPRMK